MRKLFLLFWFVASHLYGQVLEDFESGKLVGWEQSSVGRWEASNQQPVSGTYSLHHIFDNTSSDSDQISYAIFDLRLEQGLTTWRFKIRHSYSPSSLNNWAIHLISDQSSQKMLPGGSLNGYIIGVNYTGSDDILKLWKSTDGDISAILTTGLNWQNNISIDSTAAIEVTRTQDGQWTIFISANGNFDDLTELGTIQSDEIIYPGYFGVYYEYSSTQDRKFWLDDLSISGTFVKDTVPPKLENLQVISSTELEIMFNEPIQDSTMLDTLNFLVDQGIGHPFILNKTSDKSVLLRFRKQFENETSYHLEITEISDLSGNQITNPVVEEFFYYLVKPNGIVINEVMADPDPSVGLPLAEYIELRNNSNYEVCLEGWTITVGTRVKEIPKMCIPEEEYLIVCSSEDTSYFSQYGLVVGIDDLPTLTNSGLDIIVSDTVHQVISYISYETEWYHDDFKKEGGWSLEQIDPYYPCSGIENWKASKDIKGGTPGQINSVNVSNPDILSPELWKAFVVDDTIVEVHFNEPYDREIALQNYLYRVDISYGIPGEVRVFPPGFTKLHLVYSRPFERGKLYSLFVENGFTDCAGNNIGDQYYIEFGIPEVIDSLDLVINEILFNPWIGGVDFIEIFNRSDKIIDVGELKIATRDNDTWELKSLYQLSSSHHLLLPQEYLVLSIDPQKIIDQYPASNPHRFIKLNEMPAYSNTEGTAVLLDKWYNIIDEINYDESMHFSLLQDVEGISLERLHPDKLSMDPANWHSAAETVGFATPGSRNSQFTPESESSLSVWVEPEVFSPDNDGYNDFVQVFYDFNEPGYIANVIVYDSQGRRVRYLNNNELLGTTGSFIWDGENDAGEKASIGIYVFFIEVFNTRGEVKGYKKTCVLARELN